MERLADDKSKRYWPLLLMAALAFGSNWQVPPIMPAVDWVAPDKALHFAVYGLLATLFQRCFRNPPSAPAAGLAWAAATLFGWIEELIQSFNPVRMFDPADLAADSCGALVAVLVYRHWPSYRRLLERPILPPRAA